MKSALTINNLIGTVDDNLWVRIKNIKDKVDFNCCNDYTDYEELCEKEPILWEGNIIDATNYYLKFIAHIDIYNDFSKNIYDNSGLGMDIYIAMEDDNEY
jgi:hypothetical protein